MDDPILNISQRNLPKWEMATSTYFVTFKLVDDADELRAEERAMIAGILADHHKERYHLWAWVVMNDHVHAVFTPLQDWTLSKILHTWKSFSANQLQRRFNRVGQVWQTESYNRIIRSEIELYEKGAYTVDNPRRRWPDIENYEWVGSNWM